MRKLIVLIVLLSAAGLAGAGNFTGVIVPVAIQEVRNDTVRQEVQAIITGTDSGLLHRYKTKTNADYITMYYLRQNWEIGVSFKIDSAVTGARSKGRSREVITPRPVPEISMISFRHVKYWTMLQAESLRLLNERIARDFDGRPSVLIMQSFISKDRRRNYLQFAISGNGIREDFILIFINSEYSACVVNRHA